MQQVTTDITNSEIAYLGYEGGVGSGMSGLHYNGGDGSILKGNDYTSSMVWLLLKWCR